jgi:hypothetical protein
MVPMIIKCKNFSKTFKIHRKLFANIRSTKINSYLELSEKTKIFLDIFLIKPIISCKTKSYSKFSFLICIFFKSIQKKRNKMKEILKLKDICKI